jgi:hypothetical protein
LLGLRQAGALWRFCFEAVNLTEQQLGLQINIANAVFDAEGAESVFRALELRFEPRGLLLEETGTHRVGVHLNVPVHVALDEGIEHILGEAGVVRLEGNGNDVAVFGRADVESLLHSEHSAFHRRQGIFALWLGWGGIAQDRRRGEGLHHLLGEKTALDYGYFGTGQAFARALCVACAQGSHSEGTRGPHEDEGLGFIDRGGNKRIGGGNDEGEHGYGCCLNLVPEDYRQNIPQGYAHAPRYAAAHSDKPFLFNPQTASTGENNIAQGVPIRETLECALPNVEADLLFVMHDKLLTP